MNNSNTQAKGLNDLSNAIDNAMTTEQTATNNPFPIDAFPLLFRDLITDLNTSLKFPIDYTGTAILTAVATAVGTTAKVRVKNNWFEYASIYSCVIGDAGANKTHPINTIFGAIRELDKGSHDTFVELHKEYSIYQKLSKKEKEDVPPVMTPILTKSLLTNFTPEVLNKRLNENLRGCTVVSDEMATFFDGMNNYSKGDQISVYLSFWSNQPTTIDRIGDPIPLFIKNPYLSIIGGLQPRMLSSSFPIQKLNNGFFQRFLFAFPEVTFKQPINDNDNDDAIFDKYKDFIKNYISNSTFTELNGNIESKILKWTPEAKTFFYKWQSDNCDLVNEYQNNIKGEIASKYDNHFIRLSLLLQMMFDPQSDYISITAVQGAKELCRYYMNCAFKVLAVIQNPVEYLETLNQNKKDFYRTVSEKFTTAEAIALGLRFEFLERRVKEFLNDTILFKKIKHGTYEKIIKQKQENLI
jgi:hypothetical protein